MKTAIFSTLTRFIPILLLSLATQLAAEPLSLKDRKHTILLSGATRDGNKQRVTVKQIEQLKTHQVAVFNPYEDRTESYSGVWMKEFVQHFGQPDVTRMKMHAVDDYSIEFNASEWNDLRILMATRTNGKYMGYELKGPIRIIFPDYDPKLEVYKVNLPKWMWMINKVEFE